MERKREDKRKREIVRDKQTSMKPYKRCSSLCEASANSVPLVNNTNYRTGNSKSASDYSIPAVDYLLAMERF